jgi:hypothetical protein
MTKLLYDTITTQLLAYPRHDNEPVVGLDLALIVLELIQVDPPQHDPLTHRLDRTQTIDLTAGTVTQGWQLVAIAPAPPAPDWLGFAGWLYVFPPIAAAMAAARASTVAQGEPATTGLATALQDARLNQNYPVWQATWGQFLLASGMAAEPLGQIVARAIECHLPAEFVATLTP